MKSSSLKRDSKGIKSLLSMKGDGVYTSKDIKLCFPERYADVNLAILDINVSTLGICFLLVGNSYHVMLLPVFLNVKPDLVNMEEIDGVPYYMLTIKAGEKVFDKTIVRNGAFAYHILSEFVIKGNIPFFVEYEDIPTIFDLFKKYVGSDLFLNPIKAEIFTSVIGRKLGSPKEYHRYDVKSKIRWVGLNDKNYGPLSNISRLSGGYMANALVAAINDEPKSQSSLEKAVLR